MYDWRKMTSEQRQEVVEYRSLMRFPFHQPPHRFDDGLFHLSTACYEHKHHIGFSPNRIADFSKRLIEMFIENYCHIYAWSVLPNHYHLLLRVNDLKAIKIKLGKLHGKTSREWNLIEQTVGRQVWYRCSDRYIRSDRHFFATINYVNNNAVHHGYVKHWQDWPFSSAEQYINQTGKDHVLKIWKEYPVLNYGEGWDNKSM